MLMGIGRTLANAGVPITLLTRLQLEAAQIARRLGQATRDYLQSSAAEDGHQDDLSKVAVQLAAAAFEIAFLDAARGGTG
jgi:hypothetical protein